MAKSTRKGQAYRHTPAFILLFLARQDYYGSALMNTLQNELPRFVVDSAVIYRVLKDLELEGAVTSYWETDTSGPARKWYTITRLGIEKLSELKADIEMRMQNFESFLRLYDTLVGAVPGQKRPES